MTASGPCQPRRSLRAPKPPPVEVGALCCSTWDVPPRRSGPSWPALNATVDRRRGAPRSRPAPGRSEPPRVRGVDAATARRAIAEGVPACGHCRPDRELGILDRLGERKAPGLVGEAGRSTEVIRRGLPGSGPPRRNREAADARSSDRACA
ncbi:DUF6233 domain-containing protein [Streptomyces sp. NPDC048242]|uniref:DUF6233 domain-containing protein n=1 Tax=Streptomyces sp. NPDC048242 TaxID=3155026 RepID=UPI00342CDBC1